MQWSGIAEIFIQYPFFYFCNGTCRSLCLFSENVVKSKRIIFGNKEKRKKGTTESIIDTSSEQFDTKWKRKNEGRNWIRTMYSNCINCVYLQFTSFILYRKYFFRISILLLFLNPSHTVFVGYFHFTLAFVTVDLSFWYQLKVTTNLNSDKTANCTKLNV